MELFFFWNLVCYFKVFIEVVVIDEIDVDGLEYELSVKR